MPIQKIKARQIFDSRGYPTLEVDVITDIGLLRSSVPSTLFPNENEAKEVRDGEAAYNGRSVFKAVSIVNDIIAPELIKSGLDVTRQRDIDCLMLQLDGTDDKSKLGANSILGVSVACCKAAAAKKGIPLYKYIANMADNGQICLPVPIFSVICGGRAAGNPLAFQEFAILPTGAQSFADAMKMGTEIYREIEKKLSEMLETPMPLPVGDEGAFAPVFEEDKEAVAVIDEAIKSAGYDGKVKIAIDMAASAFCKDGQYDLAFKSEDSDPDGYLEAESLKEQYLEFLTEFPSIVSIEDPFDLEDWESWPTLADQKIQIVADDLTAMKMERIEEAIDKQAANCLTIRLSQIGTVTEALDCAKMARLSKWGFVISAGYGETEDTFVADLVVGLSAGQYKGGAPSRTDRMAKYNQILRIEEELGPDAKYAGDKFQNPSATC